MRKRNVLPSLETLDKLFSYNPDTGIIVRKVDVRGGFLAGTEAGSLGSHGYRTIYVQSVKYPAHRIAWKIYHRTEPPDYLDHKDRVKDHNWITNLRSVSQCDNMINKSKHKNNTSGHTGVFENGDGWKAMIGRKGEQIYLGTFAEKQDAINARIAAEAKYHKLS